MEKAYPIKKPMAKFPCHGEAILSDPLAILPLSQSLFFHLSERGRRLYVSRYLRKCDHVQISPRRRHRLRRHFKAGNGCYHLRNANASLFYIRSEDITLFFLHLLFCFVFLLLHYNSIL